MTLEELFTDLSYGELGNLALANDGNGTIQQAQQPRITRYANEGLTRLYSRFVLKESDILLELHEEITFYHLLPRFAVNYVASSPEDDAPVRYLLDLPEEPFTGDVLRILAVHDAAGCRLPLNDEESLLSVYTPQANLLQVPSPIEEKLLTVLYQAKHPKLLGSLSENIQLPDTLLGALTAYIGYKVYSHMNTQESTMKAQEHMGNYERICAEVLDKDLVSTSISATNTRFDIRGWI